jgi:hypothetical protein
VGDHALVVGLHADMLADAISAGLLDRCLAGKVNRLDAGLVQNGGTCSAWTHGGLLFLI